jgi:hypothetical protein
MFFVFAFQEPTSEHIFCSFFLSFFHAKTS